MLPPPKREIILLWPLDGLAVRQPLLCSIARLIKNIDIGVSLGAWVAGGVTGGHVNPVVHSLPGLSPSPSLSSLNYTDNIMHGCL